MKIKIFVVEMLRFGEDETHHYIIGTYSSAVQAKFAGEVEKTWRGGNKYDYRIVQTELDAPMEQEKVDLHYGWLGDGKL